MTQKNLLVFAIILISSLPYYPLMQKDPEELLKKVKAEFEKVKDYSVDVKITVDVEFIKVPESNAKIYFKQPDRISLKSDGFAMLPRKGFDFSPNALLKGDYTAIYEKEEILKGINTAVIKVIPLGSTEDIILSTLWIDKKRNSILKIESTTKTSGTFIIQFVYDENFKYPLPQTMIFSFNIDKMNFPSAMLGETETRKDKSKSGMDTLTRGKVIVQYTNYKVNEGVPDSVFED